VPVHPQALAMDVQASAFSAPSRTRRRALELRARRGPTGDKLGRSGRCSATSRSPWKEGLGPDSEGSWSREAWASARPAWPPSLGTNKELQQVRRAAPARARKTKEWGTT